MDDPARYSSSPGPSKEAGLLQFYRATSIILFVILLAGVGYYEYRQHQSSPTTILIGGTPAATVADSSVAAQVLKAVHQRQVGPVYLTGRNAPHFDKLIQFQHAGADAVIDSYDEATDRVAALTKTLVDADVIVVDHKWIVALPDESTAEEAIDDVRDHYSSLPPADQLDGTPKFVQNVTIERHTVSSDLTKQNALDAATLLCTPPPPVTYTVLPRETGWLIARKFHMSFSDFLRANSGTNVNRLSPGDFVVVSKTFPPVDVIVKKISQQNQSFGGTGVRQVTLESTYVDGQLTGTPVATSIVTLHRASLQAQIN